ncbi:hypothetical protein L3X38_031146 [Prunus dulcis]|uniref:TIR domain-containing protein n=1 Tax=Prunus dulcis TaxID=3755 RepID=A0AAD4YUP6_PRUDU|nr:hypothetical protein L3X38_031146 [Prunus dulcis]
MARFRHQEASSSTSSPSPCCYDVFLSFRGEDTRKNFSDHLYTACVEKGFNTFRDDEELERGVDIKPELKKAIQQSRSSVIVFSKDYSSSRWCLDELVFILEQKRISEHVVLPVFYDVDPSQVRNQTGCVAEAFSRHEENQLSTNKVKQWRAALREVADLSGMVLQNHADGYESKFIMQIVKVIDNKLSRTPFAIAPYPIGIDSRVENINSWLQDGSTDVGILLVNGVGGIGKTTLAKFAYNINFRRFERSCFLEDVREISNQPNGLVHLQIQFLHHIMSGREVKIHSVSEGIKKIRDAIISKTILLVLDDVDHMDQIDAIFFMQDWFCPGSKIMITTRCAGLLRGHQVAKSKVYDAETLDVDESLQLFSWHAFGQDHPIEGYISLSKRVEDRCGGLPLALQVLGSSLSGRRIDVWESTLEKLKTIPDNQIIKKLRISYDALQDNPDDQNLFLHIACFFVGQGKDYVVRILDGCNFFTIVGIENLVNRCLVTIDDENNVKMHQMIWDMGREIVRLESKAPGKRSRLWRDKDSFDVLKEKSGTETIEGLALNMRMLSVNTPSGNTNEVVLETNAFSRMSKLELLQLCHLRLNGCYEEFPKGLRWLCWLEFPSKSLPSEIPLECLVYLEMHHSNLRQVFNRKKNLRQVLKKGRKHLPSLKTLDLSHSHSLTEIGNFSLAPNLERLILKDCASLVDVHESIGNLKRLNYLNMKDCKKIRKLPKNLFMLKSVDTLIVSGCSSLNEFPKELRNMESLKVLKVTQALTTTGNVKSCLRRNPETFWASLPSSLTQLKLKSCNLSDEAFPKDIGNLPSLELLDLSDNPISGLPDCIRGVTRLDQLLFSNCKRLKTLVGLPRARYFGVFDCALLEKVTFQSSLFGFTPFEVLSISNPKLVEIEYMYKLEPLGNCDVEMLDLLGLSKYLESMETVLMIFPCRIAVESCRAVESTKLDWIRRYPIQGLYESGIFSTFLPGNVVPGHFSYTSRKSWSISFSVPSSTSTFRIRGLNVFSMYTCSGSGSYAGYSCEIISPIIIKVSNKSTGMKWIYDPSCFGIPDPGEDMIFLSHWKMGNQLLKGGDQVTVSMFMRSVFQLKEWGVQVVHEQDQENIRMMRTQHDDDDNDDYECPVSFPCVIFARSPEFEVMSRTYFLSHGPQSRRALTFTRWRDSVLFNDIFGDSDQQEEQALPLATTMRDAEDNRYFVFSMLAVDVLYDNVVLRSCLFGTQS